MTDRREGHVRGRYARALAVLAVILVTCAGTLVAPGTAVAQADRSVRASHILYSPNHDPSGARTLDPSDPAWAVAKTQADVAYASLTAITDRQARMVASAARARADSDDTGSGRDGGDLGAFTRDLMVEPFGDAIFDAGPLTPGDILPPVRTEFGWHVIMYTGEGSDTPSATPEPSAVTQGRAPVIELINPGAEPRTRLRYTPEVGAAVPLVVMTTQRVEAASGGTAVASISLAIRMDWSMSVTEVQPDGSFRLALAVTGVDISTQSSLDQATQQRLRVLEASLVGLSAWAVLDARGQSLDSGIVVPAGLDPSLEQTLRGSIDAAQTASPPLPIEAVGVGARWRTTAMVPSASLPDGVRTNAVFTLERVSGDGIVLRSNGTVDAQPGPLALPGVPAGTTAQLLSVAGTVIGTTAINLHAIGVIGDVVSTSHTVVQVTSAAGTVDVTSDELAAVRIITGP